MNEASQGHGCGWEGGGGWATKSTTKKSANHSHRRSSFLHTREKYFIITDFTFRRLKKITFSFLHIKDYDFWLKSIFRQEKMQKSFRFRNDLKSERTTGQKMMKILSKILKSYV